MNKLSTINFHGESKNVYAFDIYDINDVWDSIEVVYVVTRAYSNPNGGITHKIIYIGETGNLNERFYDHHKQSCFDSNNANRLCLKIINNETERFTIETDLINYYNPPCNN